ncbi:MAG: carbohydrate-binding family 9-like protein [Candidatus Aminicenantaceae bacterium]
MSTTYGCGEDRIGDYTCFRAPDRIEIDGRLEEACWARAPHSPRFVDMVTGAPGFWDTRMAALWDDDHLYIAFWVEEPDVRARFTERDSPVYFENDIEVFIAGEDCYYEFQINAQGTIYEVFYIWQDAYTRGSRFDTPEFDLLSRPVDMLGGFQDELRHGKHPRGQRWAFRDWDFPGLRAAVQVHGTLNNSTDVDQGWTVELAFPWDGMTILAGERALPPEEGDVWRMDFSRFEALEYSGIQAFRSPGWSFNPHGVYDSHIPECFTRIHFSNTLA